MKVQFNLHLHLNYDGNANNITVNNKEIIFFFAVAMIAKLALKINRDRSDVNWCKTQPRSFLSHD